MDLYAVLLFLILMPVLALVLVVGTLEGARSRARAQLDMAALTATQAIDFDALARGEPPQLVVAEAERLARQYLAHPGPDGWPLVAGRTEDCQEPARP